MTRDEGNSSGGAQGKHVAVIGLACASTLWRRCHRSDLIHVAGSVCSMVGFPSIALRQYAYGHQNNDTLLFK